MIGLHLLYNNRTNYKQESIILAHSIPIDQPNAPNPTDAVEIHPS